MFFENAGGSLSENGMGNSRVLSDEKSFSSGGGNAAGEPGVGDEVADGNLYPAVQPTSQTLGASLWRAIQSADYRRALAALSARGVGLRPPESFAGEPGEKVGTAGGI